MNLVPKKNYYSLICILILSYILFRTAFMCPRWTFDGTNAVISWDIFGYYLYLPSYFIYDDLTVCITITAIVLGTNYFEYATFSAAMTHDYLFTLYAIVILLSINWHEKPKAWKAALLGFVIGIITITRPTDCIIALVPIL